jgi:hypothetical protein
MSERGKSREKARPTQQHERIIERSVGGPSDDRTPNERASERAENEGLNESKWGNLYEGRGSLLP